MVYLFERESDSMRIETRFNSESRTYEIIWRKADGTVTQETFKGETSFRSRLDEIYSDLEQDDWRTIGPPQLQRDGWRI
jgi:hypothetical protein